jgi:hypothetical protein
MRFLVSVLLSGVFLLSHCLAQDIKVILVDVKSKELKRTAHRMRIPVEQLRNARQTLQEATDLALKLEPVPVEQYSSLGQSWTQLNPGKAKTQIEQLIEGLRRLAQKPPDAQTYQRATSAAVALVNQAGGQDQQKVLQTIQSWPAPPDSLGESARNFRALMQTQAQASSLARLSYSDPEKALSMLPKTAEVGTYNYAVRGQIAQGLMNNGKQDQAYRLIDETMADFAQRSQDPRASAEYENFLRTVMSSVDSDRAFTIFQQMLAPLLSQAPPGCTGSLKIGEKSVPLSCAESKAVSILRSYPSRPGLTLRILESVPGLYAKIDSVGGIDALFSPMRPSGSQAVSFTYGTNGPSFRGGVGGTVSSSSYAAPGNSAGIDTNSLYQELRGKAESNPSYVRGRIRESTREPGDSDVLINLASRAAFEDADLAEIALKLAEEILPGLDPLTKRANYLQSIIRTYRQVDGEVEPEILRGGFVLADQMRQEEKEKNTSNGLTVTRNGLYSMNGSTADQLESFLIAELARDSFDKAIQYTRSLPDTQFKLRCLLEITNVLRSQNY